MAEQNPSSSSSSSSWQRVLRVIQLDSAVLDEEVLQLLQSQLKYVFKYMQGEATKWQPELNMLIRCLLWRFTIYENSSTIGQSLFNVRYAIQTDKGCKAITLKHKLIIGIVYVGRHWMSERIDNFMRYIDGYAISSQIRQLMKWFENFWQLASAVNFLVFLQQGTYASLFERLIGLRHIYVRKQRMRKLSFEYTNRELLWHGCMEFIAFLIPLINVQKLRNFVRKIITSGQDHNNSKQASSNFSQLCPVCDKKPIHPHIVPCGHIYCYYCIKTNCLADPSFRCVRCNVAVDDRIESLKGK